MHPKGLTILGSTGSIGQSTLDVVRRFPERFRVHALAAQSNIDLLRGQIEQFRPALVAVFDPEAAERLRERLPAHIRTAVRTGMEGLLEAASDPAVEQVVSGMVGAVGLRPTYAAIDAGKQVAIANKETLVLAGELMVGRAAETGALLLPMDSEHNAVFQCLGGATAQVHGIVLTASGGPFRDWPAAQFGGITREQALRHPTWSMGPKITIDSATMLNKGLEVIEARWLFGFDPGRIRVLIHRQSIVHSLVEFVDGSVIAQLGLPDMRTPISYCLAYPDRLPLELPRLNLAEVGRLDFEEVAEEKYPCLFLALRALQRGGGAPAVLNGANEAIVAAYLARDFAFTEIAGILRKVMGLLERTLERPEAPACLARVRTVEDALAADGWGREAAQSFLERIGTS
jgi:1-deoxy-D-xylulose-5-phosphate reductoisomerase